MTSSHPAFNIDAFWDTYHEVVPRAHFFGEPIGVLALWVYPASDMPSGDPTFTQCPTILRHSLADPRPLRRDSFDMIAVSASEAIMRHLGLVWIDADIVNNRVYQYVKSRMPPIVAVQAEYRLMVGLKFVPIYVRTRGVQETAAAGWLLRFTRSVTRAKTRTGDSIFQKWKKRKDAT